MTIAAAIADLWWAAGPRPGGGEDGGRDSNSRTHVRRHDDRSGSSEDPVMARIRAGDEAAFDEVVSEMFPLLARVASRLIGSMAEGEDIAQEVLFQLWMKRETLRPATTLTVYLLGAVRNRSLNVVRDRRTAERNLADPVLTSSSAAAADDDVLADERRVVVALALAELVPRHRLAVELRYGARASFAEVGAALGVSARAAEQVVRRAVVALRRALGDSGL